jgi:prevent-host-death family protein
MAQDRSPVKKINALKARQNLGTILDEVFYRDNQFIIERAGKPMAAVVPVWQLEEWQKLQGRQKKDADTINARKRQSRQAKA